MLTKGADDVKSSRACLLVTLDPLLGALRFEDGVCCKMRGATGVLFIVFEEGVLHPILGFRHEI